MLCVPQYACKAWRTICKSGFFPFTKWVVRTGSKPLYPLNHLTHISRAFLTTLLLLNLLSPIPTAEPNPRVPQHSLPPPLTKWAYRIPCFPPETLLLPQQTNQARSHSSFQPRNPPKPENTKSLH